MSGQLIEQFLGGRILGEQSHSTDELSSLAQALRKLAATNRPLAVEKARALEALQLEDEPFIGLNIVINSLLSFPEAAQMEAFLRDLGIATEAKGEEEEPFPEYPVTPADYLMRFGPMLGFSASTGTFPVPHAAFCKSLIRRTSGNLPHMIFEQIAPQDYYDDQGFYLVTGKLNGRRYHARAENLGDYYDSGSMLGFCNAIAILEGVPERFVSLSDDGLIDVGMLTEQQINALISRKVFYNEARHRSWLDPQQAARFAGEGETR